MIGLGESYRTMTRREFDAAVEGHRRRTKEQMQMLAWATANMINVHLPRGKKVSPAELLGEKRRKFRSRAEAQEHFAKERAKREDDEEGGDDA